MFVVELVKASQKTRYVIGYIFLSDTDYICVVVLQDPSVVFSAGYVVLDVRYGFKGLWFSIGVDKKSRG